MNSASPKHTGLIIAWTHSGHDHNGGVPLAVSAVHLRCRPGAPHTSAIFADTAAGSAAVPAQPVFPDPIHRPKSLKRQFKLCCFDKANLRLIAESRKNFFEIISTDLP
jgi:hypothetical protein